MTTKHLENAARAVLETANIALGSTATETRVSVVGGLSIPLYEAIRIVDISQDVDIFLGGNVNRHELKKALHVVDSAFIVNMEGICGVTYRCPVAKVITPVDLIDRVVTGFEPRLRILAELEKWELPWPTREDVISMKAISASEWEDDAKRRQDVMDIMKILEMHTGSLQLSSLAFMKNQMPMLVQNSTWSEEEWARYLGI
ncbi:hypothetical protein THAR02_00078 [Trichoderma harzianum]|uniref:Uncharacterized protein n=1 Tax=Trichoderma harzianum TaxID=5544 RepID=A0A0F9XTK6_TRIHA|nr:hypothetical protein THAR02_00078 [Trichoderma harzianum]